MVNDLRTLRAVGWSSILQPFAQGSALGVGDLAEVLLGQLQPAPSADSRPVSTGGK